MKSLKLILVLLLFILPFSGTMAAGHSGHASHHNGFHVINFPTNIHRTAHGSSDDIFLVAEDGDGDDFSRSVSRNFTDHTEMSFVIAAAFSGETYFSSPPAVSFKRNSSSFLRVFRI